MFKNIIKKILSEQKSLDLSDKLALFIKCYEQNHMVQGINHPMEIDPNITIFIEDGSWVVSINGTTTSFPVGSDYNQIRSYLILSM